MTEVATVNQIVQIGVEAIEGEAVPTTNILNSVSIELSPDVTVTAHTATGRKFPTVASLGKDFSGGTLSGQPSYPELPFLFAALMGNLVTVPKGGAPPAYEHTFHPKTSGADLVKSLTVERGDTVTGAHRAAGVKLTELGFTINRETVELTGSLIGKAIETGLQLSGNAIQTLTVTPVGATGGTFTVSKGGQTTTALAYNASASAVQAALELLSTIGAGNVAVTGPNGGPYSVAFIGDLAQQPVTTISADGSNLTGLGSPYTVGAASVAVGAAPTELDQVPVQPTEWTVYLDDESTDLGTTKMGRVISADWKLSDRYAPVWVVDQSQTSYVATVENQPTSEVKLMLQANAEALALFATLRAGATKWLRLQAIGPVISGANHHEVRIDSAIKLTDIGDFADDAGVFAVDFTAQLFHDPTWGKATEAVIQTTLAGFA